MCVCVSLFLYDCVCVYVCTAFQNVCVYACYIMRLYVCMHACMTKYVTTVCVCCVCVRVCVCVCVCVLCV